MRFLAYTRNNCGGHSWQYLCRRRDIHVKRFLYSSGNESGFLLDRVNFRANRTGYSRRILLLLLLLVEYIVVVLVWINKIAIILHSL
jgi:hypothetical protein